MGTTLRGSSSAAESKVHLMQFDSAADLTATVNGQGSSTAIVLDGRAQSNWLGWDNTFSDATVGNQKNIHATGNQIVERKTGQ